MTDDMIPLEPPMPTPEQLEASADYRRKRMSTYELLRLLYEMACDKGKEELRRQFPEVFRD
jgi:hypothetical protein